MKRFAAVLLFILSASPALAESLQVLRYFQNDARYNYRIELLKRVLHVTQDEYGPAVLHALPTKMSLGRGERSLQKGQVDIAFLATNKLREEKFLAVKFPILHGILGYRILLVHKDNQAAFADIQNLSQLNDNFIGGFGSHWADMPILKDNQLNIVHNPLYPSLFAMLNAKRFDYFPRGINEIWDESIALAPNYPNIAVEETLALYYPYPVYFFVTKGNERLAERIEQGLKQTLLDGSLKRLFLKYHLHDIKRSQLHKRNILQLENHQLPEGTAQPDSRWWLELKENVGK